MMNNQIHLKYKVKKIFKIIYNLIVLLKTKINLIKKQVKKVLNNNHHLS